jgi:hypothetical protein
MLKVKKILAALLSAATLTSFMATANANAVILVEEPETTTTVAETETAAEPIAEPTTALEEDSTEETESETESDSNDNYWCDDDPDTVFSDLYSVYGEVVCREQVATIMIPYDVTINGCIVNVPSIEYEIIGGTGKASMKTYQTDSITEGKNWTSAILEADSAGTVNVRVTITDHMANSTTYKYYNFVIDENLIFDSEAVTTEQPNFVILNETELKKDMVANETEYAYVLSVEYGLIVYLSGTLCHFSMDSTSDDKLFGKQTIENGDLICIRDGLNLLDIYPGIVSEYSAVINYGSAYDIVGDEVLTILNDAVNEVNTNCGYNIKRHFRKYDITSYKLLSKADLKQDVQDYSEYYFYVLSSSENVFVNVKTGEYYMADDLNVDLGKKDIWTGDLVFIDIFVDEIDTLLSDPILYEELSASNVKEVINYGSAFDIFGKSALEQINTYIDDYNSDCAKAYDLAELDKMDVDSYNENPSIPSNRDEYDTAVSEYIDTDFVRNDGTSIYILNSPSVVYTAPYYVVSEYQKLGSFERYTLKADKYGATFKPESDGIFVISEVREVTYYESVKPDSDCDYISGSDCDYIEYKYCYDVVITYVVTVEDGKISTRIGEQQNYKNKNTMDAVNQEIKDTYKLTGKVVYDECVYEKEGFESTKSYYYSYLNSIMIYDEDFDQTAICTSYYYTFATSPSKEYILIEAIGGEVPTLKSGKESVIKESGDCAITSRWEDLVSLAKYRLFDVRYNNYLPLVVTDGTNSYEISRDENKNGGKLTMTIVTDTEQSEITTTTEETTETTTTVDPIVEPTTTTTTIPTTETTETESKAEVIEGAVYGDVNSDGEVAVSDVVVLNKYIVKSAELSDYQKILADVNLDNKIDASDALSILQKLVMMVDSLPIR